MTKSKLYLLLTVLLCATIVLSGCGSTSQNVEIGLVLSEANYKTINNSEFTIQIPRNWEVLTSDKLKFELEVPLEMAFRSNFKDLFFTPVISIEKILLEEETGNNEDFAKASVLKTSNTLINYELQDEQALTTSTGGSPVTTMIVKFQGKEKLEDDTLEYIQTFLRKKQLGYIVTAAYDPTDNNVEYEKILNSLRTFKLK